MKLSLPPKPRNLVRKFVKDTLGVVSDDLEILLEILPDNPRQVKRILNMLYVVLPRAYPVDGNIIKTGTDPKKMYSLQISWVVLSILHPKIVEIAKHHPSSLIKALVICDRKPNMDDQKEKTQLLEKMKGVNRENDFQVNGLRIHSGTMDDDCIKIFEYMINEKSSIYEIFSHLAANLQLNKISQIPSAEMKELDDDLGKKLQYIISESGLIGV